MNKYWSAIICAAMLCLTIIGTTVYYLDKTKYSFVNDEGSLFRVNKYTDDAWVFAGYEWQKIKSPR